MSSSDTIQKTENTEYKDVFEIQREFKELEKKKRESLNSQKNTDNSEEDDRQVLTGVVTDINNTKYNNVELVVEYVENGQEKKETFRFSKPDDEDEFNVNNKFVRVVNFFGDRKNDPSSLMYRDIWLEKDSGSVDIDIPDNLSLKTKFSSKIKRKLKSSGQDKNISNILSITKSILPLLLVTTGLLTFYVMTVNNGFNGSIMFSLLGVLFTLMYVLFSFAFLIFGEKFYIGLMRVFVAITFFISVLYVTGNIDLTYQLAPPSAEADIIQETYSLSSTITNIIIAMSTSVLVPYSLIEFQEELNGFISKIGKAKSYLKRKYQSMRGIEYVTG